MSKKDFIALADTLKALFETNAGKEMDEISRGILMQHLANFCSEQNPRFMRGRWLDYVVGACGPNGGPIKKTK